MFKLAIVVDKGRFKPSKPLFLPLLLALSLTVAFVTPKLAVKTIRPVELGFGDLVVSYEVIGNSVVLNLTNRYGRELCVLNISCRSRVLVSLSNKCLGRGERVSLTLSNASGCPYLNIQYTIGGRTLSKFVYLTNTVRNRFDMKRSSGFNQTY